MKAIKTLLLLLIGSCMIGCSTSNSFQYELTEYPDTLQIRYGDGHLLLIDQREQIEKIIHAIQDITFVKTSFPDSVGQSFTIIIAAQENYQSTGFLLIDKVYYKAQDNEAVSKLQHEVLSLYPSWPIPSK